jgi:hypothetical protein
MLCRCWFTSCFPALSRASKPMASSWPSGVGETGRSALPGGPRWHAQPSGRCSTWATTFTTLWSGTPPMIGTAVLELLRSLEPLLLEPFFVSSHCFSSHYFSNHFCSNHSVSNHFCSNHVCLEPLLSRTLFFSNHFGLESRFIFTVAQISIRFRFERAVCVLCAWLCHFARAVCVVLPLCGCGVFERKLMPNSRCRFQKCQKGTSSTLSQCPFSTHLAQPCWSLFDWCFCHMINL